MMSVRRVTGFCRAVASVLLVAGFSAPLPVASAGTGADTAPDVAVKAAYLYNFAKFTEWPMLPDGIPLIVCIVGDDAIAEAFAATVHGQNVRGHQLEARRSPDADTWHTCHLLFVDSTALRRSAGSLDAIRTLPVLTIGDAHGFAEKSGIIELYVEGERMRFAINVDAIERSRLHLSSRLLGLAKIIRDANVQ